ncbi:uncharacterized protein LOC142646282 [Dermatophagoides pteronyssinus]|uniref:uncharacterized protein LOC142646282 n=1 Tax=Dermatophagoides pteronyssinus TaxID=6956 RepID=UPI003F672CBF
MSSTNEQVPAVNPAAAVADETKPLPSNVPGGVAVCPSKPAECQKEDCCDGKSSSCPSKQPEAAPAENEAPKA